MAMRLEWTPAERQAVESVFGAAWPLSTIRLYDGGLASWGATRTLGSRIFITRARQFTSRRDSPPMLALVVHEMVHVWQFWRVGWRYALGSLWDQLWAVVRTGDRHAAYRYVLDEARSFSDYGFEQQAQMVEDWYLRTRFDDTRSAERYCLNWKVIDRSRADEIVSRWVDDCLRAQPRRDKGGHLDRP